MEPDVGRLVIASRRIRARSGWFKQYTWHNQPRGAAWPFVSRNRYGGTVRLSRLVGQWRALDIILTDRKVTAEECYRIGACERLAPHGQGRVVAEQLAHEIARFPQTCLRSDRSVGLSSTRIAPFAKHSRQNDEPAPAL
jgi:hypothetical protein